MIRDYADHAANERTFLAWVRTGIAVIALGFVIEKFDLFVLTIGSSIATDENRRIQIEKRLEHLASPLADYGGVAIVFGGIAIIAIASARFVRIEYLLARPNMVAPGAGRAELIAMSLLILLAAAFGAYLSLG
jgi:putative membrane protein